MNSASAEFRRTLSVRLHSWIKLSPSTVVLCGSLIALLSGGQALAATPITQSGLNTHVSEPVTLPSGQTQYNITGGTRPGGGTNLFHSFGDFNVPTNNIANFLNETALPTNNILGRVTGGNPSIIFGTIQTNGPGGFGNANLFLMNPYGFLFGPNAAVNVGGMVSFSTADYLRFQGNETLFNKASTPESLSPLSITPVAAFGFLGSNPAAIAVQGSTLQVAQGQSLSLVGGNRGFDYIDPDTGSSGSVPGGVTMTGGKLSAPGGQINLASVASPGEISVDFMPTSGMTMGNISLSQEALLDVSGNAAGAVKIRGGQFVMDQAVIAADTVNADGAPIAIDINATGNVSISTTDVPALTARTTGTGNSGEVKISSGTMDMTGTAINSFLFSVIDTHTSGSGKAGNVSIDTGDLNFTAIQFAGLPFFIDSGTIGPNGGHGGDISIRAHNFTASDTGINSGNTMALQFGEESTGSAGNLSISAESLQFTNVGVVADAFSLFSDNIGRSGNISINAPNIDLQFSFISTLGGERGGALVINTDHFTANSSQLSAQTFLLPGGGITINGSAIELNNGSSLVSSTGGDGDAGPINITATDHLSLLRASPTDRQSGIFSNSFGSVSSLGNAGDITITTPRLDMTGGARINTSTATNGRGGNVAIAADSISMSGEAGDFSPEPLFALGVTQPSGIFTLSVGGHCTGLCGNAGNISINTGSLAMGTGSQINSGTSSSGQGGNINIIARDTIAMSGTLSTGQAGGIQSRTIGTDPDAGAGGNIALSAGQSVAISNGASVSASSTGPGNAGNVTIEGTNSPAQSVLIDGPGSGIFTDTQGTGAGGNIFVNANSVTLQNGGTLSAKTSGTEVTATGGTITVDANQVQLLTGGLITAATTGPGNAGSVTINAADSVTIAGQVSTLFPFPPLSARSRITTTTSGSGDGGDVTISAGQSVSLTGFQSGIFADTTNSGNAGNISITAGTLGTEATATGGTITVHAGQVQLNNQASITASSSGEGNAGTVTVTAEENIVLLGNSSIASAAEGEGNGGLVSLMAPSIELHGNSNIETNTRGLGNAGNIELQGNQVNLTEASEVGARTEAEGHGGNITIRGLTGEGSSATDVRLSDKSLLVSETIGDGEHVQGAAGNILVETARLNLSGGSLFNTTSRGSTGAAGNITVNATDSLTISGFGTQFNSESFEFSFGDAGHISISAPSVIIENNGFITTSTSLVGNAGTITVNTNNLQLLSGGHIASSSLVEFPEFRSGAAGTVSIQGLAGSAQSILIDGSGSDISTKTEGTGAGGNILVNANSVMLQNGAHVTSSSTGPGIAGDITINAGQSFTATNSKVTTEANQSSGGTIKITTNPSGTVELTNSTISASVLDGTGGGGSVNIDPQLVLLLNSQILAQAVQGPGGNISITTNFLLPDANSVISASSQFGTNGTVTIQSPNAPISGQIQPLGKSPLLATTLFNQHCAALAGGEFSSFTVAGRDSLPTEPGSWLTSPLAMLSEGMGLAGMTRGTPLAGETAFLSLRQIAPAGFLTQAFAVDLFAGCES
jgi:filamentous hemagglutinin family protein